MTSLSSTHCTFSSYSLIPAKERQQELARVLDMSTDGGFCGFTIAVFKGRKKLAMTQHRVALFEK